MQSQSKTMEGVLQVFKDYTVILSVTMSLATISAMVLYWQLEASFFPQLSPWMSHIVLLALVGLFFNIGTRLVTLHYLKSKVNYLEISELVSQDLQTAMKKIAVLEEALNELKSGTNSASNVIDINSTLGQKQSIIMHERAFLHDFSNKLHVVQAVVSIMIEKVERENLNDQKLLKQLRVAAGNLEKMVLILKENRDYLIIAT